jgi:hypothetical protein
MGADQPLTAVVQGNGANLGRGHCISEAADCNAHVGAPFTEGEPNFVSAQTEVGPPETAKSCLPAPVLETTVRQDCTAPHRAGPSLDSSAGDVTAPTIGGPGSPVVWLAPSPAGPLALPQFPCALAGGLLSGVLLLACFCFGWATACGETEARRAGPACQIGMRGESAASRQGADRRPSEVNRDVCPDRTFTEKRLRRTKPSEFVRVARAPPIARSC